MLGREVRVYWSFGLSEVEATDIVHPYTEEQISLGTCTTS